MSVNNRTCNSRFKPNQMKLTKAQEERFNKKFLMSLLPLLPMIPNQNVIDDIKQFISKELSLQRKDIVERVVNDLSDKPPCTDKSPCGCHFGEVNHFDGKCSCDIKREYLNQIK